MDTEHERQRGLEVGHSWAERTTSHNVATVASASFDDVAALLPPDRIRSIYAWLLRGRAACLARRVADQLRDCDAERAF